jgi:hypothetical protein
VVIVKPTKRSLWTLNDENLRIIWFFVCKVGNAETLIAYTVVNIKGLRLAIFFNRIDLDSNTKKKNFFKKFSIRNININWPDVSIRLKVDSIRFWA